MIERKNRIRRFGVWALCLAGMLGLSSCGIGSDTTQLTDSEIADFKAVLADVEEAVSTTMDLSDEVQYRFLIRQMELAGLTADSSPELYAAIDDNRESASAPDGSNSLNESPTLSITTPTTSDGRTYTATAEVILPEPVQMITLTLSLYDETSTYLFAQNTEQKFYADGTVTITATGDYPSGQGVFAMLLCTYVPQDGSSPVVMLMRSTTTSQP
jgi:hypothetical protein